MSIAGVEITGSDQALKIDILDELYRLSSEGELSIEVDPCDSSCKMKLTMRTGESIAVRHELQYDSKDELIHPVVMCLMDLRTWMRS